MAIKEKKIFIAGCGSIGKRHTECLHDIGVECFVFFDPEYEKAAELSGIYNGEIALSYEEGLKSDADCVYILSPTRLHIEQARKALEHGKHVFIEKPISDSIDGIDEVLALASKRGLVVEVGFCFRFHDGIRELKSVFLMEKSESWFLSEL